MAISIYTAPQVRDGSDYKIRIRTVISVLIFSFCLTSCFNKDKSKELTIQWKDNRATDLIIPQTLFPHTPGDSIKNYLTIHLFKEGDQPPIFGQYQVLVNQVVFEPLMSFTRGLTYEVRYSNQSLGKIQIPFADVDLAPEVVNVFPTQDTLPENLLKIYIKFSSPMQEDQAMNHLTLVRNQNDTVSSAFLPLQQELWNKDRTILTVWLHPGRIKRDLQPNLNFGTPLQEGGSYQIIISPQWMDINGAMLKQPYNKKFTVVSRDSISPKAENWLVTSPDSGSRNPLALTFNESLVYTLIQESIEIYNSEKKPIEGHLEIMPEETGLSFIPTFDWKKGKYLIWIQSRLEDLAGNNLNRAFDQDISIKNSASDSTVFEIRFEVK